MASESRDAVTSLQTNSLCDPLATAVLTGSTANQIHGLGALGLALAPKAHISMVWGHVRCMLLSLVLFAETV